MLDASSASRQGFAAASANEEREEQQGTGPRSSIPARSRRSLLGLLSLPKQQAEAAAAARAGATDSSSSSFFALCYADAGVAEALRSRADLYVRGIR